MCGSNDPKCPPKVCVETLSPNPGYLPWLLQPSYFARVPLEGIMGSWPFLLHLSFFLPSGGKQTSSLHASAIMHPVSLNWRLGNQEPQQTFPSFKVDYLRYFVTAATNGLRQGHSPNSTCHTCPFKEANTRPQVVFSCSPTLQCRLRSLKP